MTIVDKTHAAEFVTKKGRAYKFDAVECLINDLKIKMKKNCIYFSNRLSKPEELINATTATYLISEEIKSPMGANLSAFKTKAALHTWKNL